MNLKLASSIMCALALGAACQTDPADGPEDASGGTSGSGGSTGGNGSGGASGGANPAGGTGGAVTGGQGGEGGDGGEGGAASSLVLTAADFEDGDELPDQFTCEGGEFGDGISPELSWE